MHYSHVVDLYQHNKVELHHLLYSDIYRIKSKHFTNGEQNPDKEKSAIAEYSTIHENLYALTKEEAAKNEAVNGRQQVRLENNTLRKIAAGLVNMLYKIFPFIGRWIAKDTNPDEAIRTVLTAPPSKKENKAPEPTKIFCSEFVENSLIIAASQSPALFEAWNIHRRSRYIPPEALVDHLKQADLAEEVVPEIPLIRMFK